MPLYLADALLIFNEDAGGVEVNAADAGRRAYFDREWGGDHADTVSARGAGRRPRLLSPE
jgi:hypothetical protein